MVTLNYKENDQVLPASELMENLSFTLSNMLAFAIDGATTTNQNNLILEDFSDEGDINTGSTTAIYDHINSSGGNVYFAVLFDDFENASIDSGKWSTSGTVAESSGSITISSSDSSGSTDTSTLISDGASGFDARSFSGNSELVVVVDVSISTGNDGGDNADTIVQISNGSTHIDIYTKSASAGGSVSVSGDEIRVVFNKSGETCDVWVNGTKTDDDVDISSVTTNWHLRVITTAFDTGDETTTSSLGIRTFCYLDGSAGSSILQSTASTASATTSAAILKPIWDVEPATKTLAFSADNASNFTNFDAEEDIKGTSDTGTNVVLKFTVTHPTTISATSRNIPTLDQYGAYYG